MALWTEVNEELQKCSFIAAGSVASQLKPNPFVGLFYTALQQTEAKVTS